MNDRFLSFYEELESEKKRQSKKIEQEFNYKNIFFLNLLNEEDMLKTWQRLEYDVIFIRNNFVFIADVYRYHDNSIIKDRIKSFCKDIYGNSNIANAYKVDTIKESITIDEVKKLISSGAINKFQLTQVNYQYESATTDYYITSNIIMKDSFLDYDKYLESSMEAMRFIEEHECLNHLYHKVLHLYRVNSYAYALKEKIVHYGIPELIKQINKIS